MAYPVHLISAEKFRNPGKYIKEETIPMRNLKKFLALALAMVMAFSLMVTANAAHAGTQYNDEDTVTPAFSEAVEVLTGMGVFQGDNNSFRPASNITRAEVAAIIYRLVTGDTGTSKMDLYTTRHPFTDVRADAWYAGYVGYLYNAKIIKGTTTTTFNPAGNVTGYEVLAMILRAVGYDKNDEFTGGTWRVEVGSTATELGILRDIDSTHYGDTLNLASRRDVVASMLFRTAAYVPMVQYTLAFGYQDTGMEGGVVGSEKNPTLGYKYFGLKERTGAIVGNQATRESYTLLGSTGTAQINSAGNVTGMWYNDNVNYDHKTESNLTGTDTGALMLAFNFNTGLDYFGHKATVWYDARTASGSVDFGTATSTIKVPTAYRTTYAVVDKATLVKTVWADDLKTSGSTDGKISIHSAAVAAGFGQWGAPSVESDRYAQFTAISGGTAANQSKVGMYKVISNNDGRTADVVIALNQEVAQITQVNTTVQNGQYIYLGTGASNFGSQLAGTGVKGMVYFNQLSGASVKTLGTLVTAHQIVGTNYDAKTTGNAYGTTPGSTPYKDWTGSAVTAAPANPEDMMYQTDKLEPGLTGTIATYKAVNTNVSAVTLADGTVLNLSGITGSLDPWTFDTYEHLINGLGKLTNSNTKAGVTYTFYFDEVGRFIGVSAPTEYSFLYTTFADYQIGNLGTGTIGYYAYGVDWDGNIVKDKQITSITLPIYDDGTYVSFNENTGGETTYPGSGTLATGYTLLPTTMKNQGNAVTGNEIKEGANTRFMMNPAGHMSWYGNVGGRYGTEFYGFDNSQGIVSNGSATINDYTWQITSQDAVNGFKRVYNTNASGNQNAYLLTNATKFIVVTGSGTADLSVKTYNGIAELVGNGSSAEIDLGWNAVNSKFTKDNVYFLTSADRYGNVDTSDNATIDTVILSDSNLSNYAAQSLYFSEPGNTKTNVQLAGYTGSTINQYKLYSGGQAGYYWIDEGVSGITADGNATLGDFYQLTPVNNINGQTIYKAVKVTNTKGTNVGATYDYIVVNDMSTAEITFSDNTKQVFKVTSSTVTLALGDNDNAAFRAIFPFGVNITDIQTLNHAVSMGKAGTSGDLYKVSVAIVWSGINMVDIYVTNIA